MTKKTKKKKIKNDKSEPKKKPKCIENKYSIEKREEKTNLL